MLPRSSFIALATFLTIGVVLILRQRSASFSFYRSSFAYGRSLNAWLRDEEARYVLSVQDRHRLIRRWGPTDVDVES